MELREWWDLNLKNSITGFSFLELLCVLLIAAIVLGFAIPAQHFLVEKFQQQSVSETMLRAIQLARSEAILRGEKIIICRSTDQQTCSGKWRDGFVVLAQDKVLYAFRHPVLKGELHWRMFPVHREDLQFLPSGLLDEQNGTFWYCEKNAVLPVWAIVINKSGRVRLLEWDDKSEMNEEDLNLKC